MELDTFILADAAAAHDQKLFVQGGGVSRLTAPGLPLVVPHLAIVVRFLVRDAAEVTTRTHEVAVAITDPAGNPVVSPPPLTIPRQPHAPERVDGEELALMVIVDSVNLVFPLEGINRVTIRLDGTPVREMTLPLVVTPPQPAKRVAQGAQRPSSGRPPARRKR